MADILILHGPNLNLIGKREPQHYGTEGLASLNRHLFTIADEAPFTLEIKQSNAESELIECIHEAHAKKTQLLIFNPAAFTHTSVALRDALLATALPFIEVHISNIHAREPYRRTSYFSDIALGSICGLGTQGYALALQAAITRLTPHPLSSTSTE